MKKVIKVLISTHPEIIKYVSPDNLSIKIYQTACSINPDLIKYIPSDILTDKFFKKMTAFFYDRLKAGEVYMFEHLRRCSYDDFLKNNYIKLFIFSFLPKKYKSEELCKEFILKNRSCLDLQFIPKKILTENFIQWMINNEIGRLDTLPLDVFSRTTFINACKKNIDMLSLAVPEGWKTEYINYSLKQKQLISFKYIPDSIKSFEFCYKFLIRSSSTDSKTDWLNFVPKKLMRSAYEASISDNHLSINYPSTDYELNVLDEETVCYLFGAYTHSFLDDLYKFKGFDKEIPTYIFEFVIASGIKTQFYFLENKNISINDKQKLIRYLFSHEKLPAFDDCDGKKIISGASPLRFQVANPYLKDLVVSAYTELEPEMCRKNIGGKLCKYVSEITSNTQNLFTNTEIPSSVFSEGCKRVGGRTLQIVTDDHQRNVYYKFQRKDEPLKDLAREGAVHSYIHQNDLSKSFKSEVPINNGYLKFYLDDTLNDEFLGEFTDGIEVMTDNDGRRYVHVYSYQAPRDYSVYSHTPKSNHDNRFQKPEAGILNACHDIGRLAS